MKRKNKIIDAVNKLPSAFEHSLWILACGMMIVFVLFGVTAFLAAMFFEVLCK